jgi:uncharacterized membrane protein
MLLISQINSFDLSDYFNLEQSLLSFDETQQLSFEFNYFLDDHLQNDKDLGFQLLGRNQKIQDYNEWSSDNCKSSSKNHLIAQFEFCQESQEGINCLVNFEFTHQDSKLTSSSSRAAIIQIPFTEEQKRAVNAWCVLCCVNDACGVIIKW